MSTKPTVTVKEAMTILGVTRSRISQLIREGKLKVVRMFNPKTMRGYYLITQASLNERLRWLQLTRGQHPKGGKHPPPRFKP